MSVDEGDFLTAAQIELYGKFSAPPTDLELERFFFLDDGDRRLGLVINCITLWNTVCLDRILQQLRDGGDEIRDEDVARLSPYMFAHINVHGHYSFTPLNLAAGIGNRPLHDPVAED